MLFKVFAKTGEELYDTELRFLEDLIRTAKESKKQKVFDGYIQNINLSVLTVKGKEYYSIEIEQDFEE